MTTLRAPFDLSAIDTITDDDEYPPCLMCGEPTNGPDLCDQCFYGTLGSQPMD